MEPLKLGPFFSMILLEQKFHLQALTIMPVLKVHFIDIRFRENLPNSQKFGDLHKVVAYKAVND